MNSFFANLFGYILNFIYGFIGNYGWAIILFSIVIKIIMSPISIKQQKTMQKSMKLQDKMKEIQFKYKNNPEKLNEATIELYKTEKLNPFSGCFSAIIQLVLLLSVFYLVRSPLTYMTKSDKGVIEKYTKIMQEYGLSKSNANLEIDLIREIDNILDLKKNAETKQLEGKTNLNEINEEELKALKLNMNFLGLDLAQVPTSSGDWKAYIIPILYVLVTILSNYILNPSNSNKKKNKNVVENKDEKALAETEENPMEFMNKNMNLMMPILSLTVALVAPLGLALYWLMSSLMMIVEKLILNKLLKNEEEK